MLRSRGLVERARLLRGRVRLGELLDRLAAVHGDRRLVEQAEPIALAGGVRRLTYREAAGVVARAAAVLAPRLEGRRRAVVRGANDYAFFLACLAVSRAGGVVVPVNPRMPEGEVEHVVADAEAEVVDVDDLARRLAAKDEVGASDGDGTAPAGAGGAARPAPSGSRDDEVAAIFYTSGTTGRPKGARLAHRALVEPASWGSLWPAGLRRDELVVSLPIAHIMGFGALVSAAGSGLPVYLLPRFSPLAVLDAIEERRATVFVGVPAMYRMMLEAGAEERDLTSVRLWVSAADVMPPDLARRFKAMGASATLPLLGRAVGEATFAQGYGMVELGGAATAKVSPPGTSLGLGDLLGVSLAGRRLRVVDDGGRDVAPGEVGELLVRAAGALRGYHGDPDGSREVVTDGGWVRTGDLARRGRFGALHFAGRKKDVVLHGGYTVYPAEVEEVLRAHPAVAEVAVVGRPDEVLGEVPVAVVRLEPGEGDADGGEGVGEGAGEGAASERSVVEDLLAHGRARLADYKTPVEVVVVDDFPRTGTGKIAKAALRERIWGP